tara:strand:- start:440 stop:655 length:216 start_codon:yes stop_codon:yes gene_type:complete
MKVNPVSSVFWGCKEDEYDRETRRLAKVMLYHKKVSSRDSQLIKSSYNRIILKKNRSTAEIKFMDLYKEFS